jgi:hypothetical protein
MLGQPAATLSQRTEPRAVQDGAAALPAAMPALAAHNPDAALIELGREYDRLAAAKKAEWARLAAASALAESRLPPPPAELYPRPEDKAFNFPEPNSLTHPGCYGYQFLQPRTRATFTPFKIINGKRVILGNAQYQIPDDIAPGEREYVVKPEPWPEAQARADEIMNAFNAWHAECQRIYQDAGYSKNEVDRLADELDPLRTAILETTAATLAGVQVKARVVADHNAHLEPEVSSLISNLLRL